MEIRLHGPKVPTATASSRLSQGWRPEEWYKAYYKEEPLDKDHLDQWREKLESALQGEASGLKLPEPNRFIPGNFSLRATDGEGLEVTKLPLEVLPPTPLVNSDMLRLWHKVGGQISSRHPECVLP